jgi:hypothetical protein
MDPFTLTAAAVTTFLVPVLPYLFKTGEKVAEEAGKKIAGNAWDWAKDLWGKLRPKVEAKGAALDAAKDVAQTPDNKDAQTVLRVQLTKLLTEDAALAQEVTEWLKRARAAGITVTASGERSVAIGGDVSGSIVNTGSGNAISGGISMKGDGNVIGAGNTVSVTKTRVAPQGVTRDDFAALIAQMSELLRTNSLNQDDRDTLEMNLGTVEKETKKDKPRLPLIESSLKSVESLVTSTESLGSITTKLLPILNRAVESAKELFQ